MRALLLAILASVEAFQSPLAGIVSHQPATFSPLSRSPRSHIRTISASLSTEQGVADVMQLPATFRALRADTAGSSFREVATVKDQPMVEPQEGQVLVKVRFAGINGGCETFRARGEKGFEENQAKADGFNLGAEGVGTVVRKGPGVEGFEPGDNVLFVGGAFAEYSVVNAATLIKVKEATKETVGLRISATTSWGSVFSSGGAAKGKVVLVTAGAGAAGSFAVQFAKQAGCTVVATTSSQEKAVALCKLGCDQIINYKTRDVDAVLKQKFPEGVDIVVEHVGGKMLQTAINNCKKGGKVVIVGYISQYPHNPQSERDGTLLEVSEMMWTRGTQDVDGVTVTGAIYKDMEDVSKGRTEVMELYEKGALKSLVDEREFQGLESIPDAVEHMLSGKTVGKVVVEI